MEHHPRGLLMPMMHMPLVLRLLLQALCKVQQKQRACAEHDQACRNHDRVQKSGRGQDVVGLALKPGMNWKTLCTHVYMRSHCATPAPVNAHPPVALPGTRCREEGIPMVPVCCSSTRTMQAVDR